MTKIKYTGALPFRLRQAGPEILLITTRRTRRWIVPKGYWSPAMKSYESAEKEAYEEAGIEGVIGTEPIGIYAQRSWRGTAIRPIMIFPLQVTYRHGVWPEKYERRSLWVTPDRAERFVEESLSRLIRRLAQRLEQARTK
jgi:8-oxo-dGTP pyrophosphatase MutT (NUDIX family)